LPDPQPKITWDAIEFVKVTRQLHHSTFVRWHPNPFLLSETTGIRPIQVSCIAAANLPNAPIFYEQLWAAPCPGRQDFFELDPETA